MFFLVTTIYYAVLCTFISSSVRDRHAKLRDGTCEAVRPRWVCQFNVCFWAVCVCSLFYSSLSSLMALRMTPEFAIVIVIVILVVIITTSKYIYRLTHVWINSHID